MPWAVRILISRARVLNSLLTAVIQRVWTVMGGKDRSEGADERMREGRRALSKAQTRLQR